MLMRTRTGTPLKAERLGGHHDRQDALLLDSYGQLDQRVIAKPYQHIGTRVVDAVPAEELGRELDCRRPTAQRCANISADSGNLSRHTKSIDAASLPHMLAVSSRPTVLAAGTRNRLLSELSNSGKRSQMSSVSSQPRAE
jgi:hypothetical protein